jgi:site-specific DNA-methyltransferase (adenine-specific)
LEFFYNADCTTKVRQTIGCNTIDLIVTDPPYGINGHKLDKHYNRKKDTVLDGYVEIPMNEYADFSKKWIQEAERILRPGGSMYIFSGYTNLHHILNAIDDTQLELVNHIIWKYNFGVFTKNKYISSHYHLLYITKPGGKITFNTQCRYGLLEKDDNDRSLNYQDREDVWIINRENKPGKVKNINELPVEILVKILQYSSNENDYVVDFFMGGFTTAKTCIGLNRNFIGFEISSDIFHDRISEIDEWDHGCLIPQLRIPDTKTYKNSGKKWTSDEIEAVRFDFD